MGAVRSGVLVLAVLAVAVPGWTRGAGWSVEATASASSAPDRAAELDIEPDPEGFEVINTQNPDDIPTPAEASYEQMTWAEGFHVTQFAAEPYVRQPIAFTLDDRGRLWVIENYSYPGWETEPTDRVLILEDTTGDGRVNRRRIFWDEGRNLTGIAMGFGGVYLISTPEIIFIPVDPETDQPAGEPVVLLDGFDDDTVGHNVVNGLTWGPDGWLYGRHGIQATSHVGAPGTPDDRRVPLNCSIWRFHPETHAFEVVAHGTTNPWGFDYDDHGHMFFTNNVNGHLFHMIPGARYRRMYGMDFNPHVYDLLGVTADHDHHTGNWTDSRADRDGVVAEEHDQLGGGHSHVGAMIYLGDNWPAEFRNNIFMFNTHGRRINQDVLEREGAGFVAMHGADILHANDPWFRGLALKYGPDGGVYFTDWNQFGECHDHDGIYRGTGRIYKMTWGEAEAEPMTDLNVAALDNADLVELQLHENDWFVRTARRVLNERAAGGAEMAEAHAALHAIFDDHPDVTRKLRAMWALYVTDGIGDGWLIDQLDHENEHVRVWAIRLLVDHRAAPAEAVERLAERAREDESDLVRLHLASALQWMEPEQRLPVADALVRHGELADDAVFPLMLWYGIEAAVPEHPQFATDLLERIELPRLRRYTARRIAAEVDRLPDALDRVLTRLATADDAEEQRDLVDGLYEGLRARGAVAAPEAWSAAHAVMVEHEDEHLRQRGEALALIFGDGQAVETLKRIARDGGASLHSRQQAIEALVDQDAPDLAPMLHELTHDVGIRRDAIRALAAAEEHDDTPGMILGRYRHLSAVERRDAIDTLTSRAAYVGPLLDAIADGRIGREDLTAFHARQILAFDDEALMDRLTEVWGAVRRPSEQRREQIVRYREQLDEQALAEADLEVGRTVFGQRCAQCHQLFGEGGTFGGDLTGSDRTNIDYLLMKIVDPSATVPEDQQTTIVTLDDGRVVTGTVRQRTDATLTLATPGGELRLDRGTIADVQTLDMSLMPEGLLDDLTDEQVRDLIAYLASTP